MKISDVNPVNLPKIDVTQATDKEMTVYLTLQGVHVISLGSGQFYSTFKSKLTLLKANTESQAFERSLRKFKEDAECAVRNAHCALRIALDYDIKGTTSQHHALTEHCDEQDKFYTDG